MNKYKLVYWDLGEQVEIECLDATELEGFIKGLDHGKFFVVYQRNEDAWSFFYHGIHFDE